MIDPWKVTVCCPNVVHKGGSETSREKCIDIQIHIISIYLANLTVVKQKLLANQNFCVMKKCAERSLSSWKFQLLTLIGVIIWYTIKYD